MHALDALPQLPRQRSSAASSRPLRIAFVVTGLEVGGAEMMLFKVLSRIDRQRFEPSLISLSSDATAMLPAFRELGIPCEVLAWRPRREVLAPIRRLARALRKLDPDI